MCVNKQEIYNVVCTAHVHHVVVYMLVQHYAHACTVTQYSDVFRWRPPPPSSGADDNTDHNIALLEGLYSLLHTSLFSAYPLLHIAVSVIPPTYVVMSQFSLTIRKCEVFEQLVDMKNEFVCKICHVTRVKECILVSCC
jgi:hypothetical protein